MTMTPTESGTSAMAVYDDSFGDIGLEDVGLSDIVIPRLSINHAAGTFKDNLSGMEFSEIEVILLGMVRQRIMWAGGDTSEEGDKPLCKSTDAIHGLPVLNTDLHISKRFPFEQSNFDISQAVPVNEPPTPRQPDGFNSNGHPVLDCGSCSFAQWGTKAGKSTPPPCAEQFTFPVKYSTDGGENWVTALFTIQKTGIKPAKQYMSSFVQTKTPLFTSTTHLSLKQEKRGMVQWSVPIFNRGSATDRDEWHDYAESMREMRKFIREAPRPAEMDDDGVIVSTSNENEDPWATEGTPAAVATPATAAPPVVTVPAPAPVAPAAPVAAPAVTVAAPAPAAPVAAPPVAVAPAVTVAPPAPVAAPVAVTPPAAPAPVAAAPAPVAAAPAADDDELPF